MTKAIEAAEGAFLRLFDTDRPAALLHLNEALRRAISAYLAAEREAGRVMVPKVSARVTYDYSGGKGAWFQFDGHQHELLDIFADISKHHDIHNLQIKWWGQSGKELRVNVERAMIAASTQHDDGGE